MRTTILALLLLLAQDPSSLIKEAQDKLTEAIRLLLVVKPSTVVAVAPGGNLQAALDAALPGTTITLQAGATYTGNFELRKPCSGCVLTTAGFSIPAGTRVTPMNMALMAKLQAPAGGQAVVRTAPGTSGWSLVGLEVLPNPGAFGNQVQLGDGAQTTLVGLPFDLTVDRCYIHGDPVVGQKRGIALNSGKATIVNSYISDMKATGQDTQAIAGGAGPGPYSITNNYLEASGENIIFGGDDPRTPNMVPADITISGNAFAKPVAWKTQGWVVKNLLELKNARRVTIEGNTFDYTWLSGQIGWAIVLTVRNQDGACTWCTIEDVIFRNNIVRHMGGCFNILGTDYSHPSGRMARVSIEKNRCEDINATLWGGRGTGAQISGGPDQLSLVDNVFTATGSYNSFITFDQSNLKLTGLKITGNESSEGDYGVIGSDAPGLGKAALDFYAPAGYEWSGNIINRGASGRNITYPAGTVVR